MAEGIQHLQMLGVKYFMAETPDIEAAADADSNLQLVGQVGPFPVTYTSGSKTTVEQRTWKIYKVADSAEVAPLIYQPVVMTGVSKGAQAWLTASESWYLNPSRWDVYEAASGPKSWARVSPTANPPRVALPPVHVSNIHEGTESISFDVDQVGVPVLVKTSYFPNWTASGASGVYRVTPNLMVVVPTSTHVTLNYGYTPVDWIGFILSLFGFFAVAFLWRLPAVEYPRPRHLLGGERPYEGPRHLATKVPGRMAVHDPAALSQAVFKAYDIRGIVPDQIEHRPGPGGWCRLRGLLRMLHRSWPGTCDPSGVVVDAGVC